MRRFLRHISALVLVLASAAAFAQAGVIRLKTGNLPIENNLRSFDYAGALRNEPAIGGKIFRLVSFNGPVTAAQRQSLAKAGIDLFDYIPEHTYTATIKSDVPEAFLAAQNIRAIHVVSPTHKLGRQLGNGRFPDWCLRPGNTADLVVHVGKGIAATEAKGYFLSRRFEITDESWKDYGLITLRVPLQRLGELAGISFVEYIEPVAPAPRTFNYLMKANTRANVLNAPLSSGGEGLRGKGVTIGVGDDGDPSGHVDLEDRVINHAAGPRQVHATHVAGIAAGTGLKDPLFEGVAPEATLVAQMFNGIFLNAAAYIADYRMVVTNNSWGNITGECDLTGVYDTYSRLMDDISIRYPYLLHVFAAGNDGPFTCQGYPSQYHTIVSGHQSAKNILSVGWAEKNQTVSPSSSVGPTADGRLKPEMVSQGSGLRSTAPNHEYFTDWGSSMAAPTVAGGAALLIEKYRQLNAGADPKSGLVKALLMNGARDIGNSAPDFKSGYGFLHLVRSLDMLKQQHYFTGTLSTGGLQSHPVTLPAGTASIKVMAYWHDAPAAVFAANALVNDLDLELVSPTGEVFLPWKLEPDSLRAANTATRGTDHLNNSEQITVSAPAPGNYTIRVRGTAVNSAAAQEYFLVYDLVPNAVDLTYPSVGEPLVPGEAVAIMWDAWGEPSGDFTLEFSSDDGASWSTLSNTIPAADRQYNWTVPNIATTTARLRLTRNVSGQADISSAFPVLAQPQVSLAAVQCEDRAHLSWTAVPGATDYEVMIKRGGEMIPVATTPATSYVVNGLNADSSYWFSVRARRNTVPGRRAVAIPYTPRSGSCSGNISDNDLKLDSLLAPRAGRKFTSTEITTSQLVVRIKNLDDDAATAYTAGYSINGGAFIVQPGTTAIPAGGFVDHVFTGLDFSLPGNYNIVVYVANQNPDSNHANDTLRWTLRHLANAPITLPYIQDFDALPAFDIRKDTLGLPGLDGWDFFNSTPAGRLRSFVNTGFARSGTRALTMDAFMFSTAGNTNFLTATFNLSNYAALAPAELGLKLEFSYRHHGQASHANNRVWARANDAAPWTEVFNFDSLALHRGEWKTVSIHLAEIFGGLPPGTSFQLRFGQHGQLPTGDALSNNGITIDDLKLFASTYDVELVEILSPVAFHCGPLTEQPVSIRYRDHRGVSGCIPVHYRVNGGPTISECMVSGTTGIYTFQAKLSLPSMGLHTLEAWTAHPADNYKLNDTTRLIIRNKPVVDHFPYLENFEAGAGNWHSEGYLSSWEWGKPASFKIKTAASGNKAWKTRLVGQYNENELSYLYSPCFDISRLAQPFLSFQMALDLEQCKVFACDILWLEYSADGRSWTKLGSYGQGMQWYNNQQENAWDSANHTGWHQAAIDLPKGLNRLQLRFVLQSDAGITREGVAIDDIAIFDRQLLDAGSWTISPNPVNSMLRLTSVHEAGARVTLQLFDAMGRLVRHTQFVAGGMMDQHMVPMGSLPAGVYLLRVADGRRHKAFKVIRQ